MTNLARLSAFQVQAFLHHAFLEQEAIHRALRADPTGNLPPPSGDFPPEAVWDAMECSAFLTASINLIALHMQAKVRLDNRNRLLQSVVPAPGRPGFPAYNRKDLLALPLNSDLVFAGKFSETAKSTMDTQEVAFQAQRLSQGLMPAHVASSSGYRIPKKLRDGGVRLRASPRPLCPLIMAPAAVILLKAHRLRRSPPIAGGEEEGGGRCWWFIVAGARGGRGGASQK